MLFLGDYWRFAKGTAQACADAGLERKHEVCVHVPGNAGRGKEHRHQCKVSRRRGDEPLPTLALALRELAPFDWLASPHGGRVDERKVTGSIEA